VLCSSFDFDRALAYAFSCVKQEGLSLKDQQVEAVKLLSEGKDVFMWLLTGYGKSICYQLLPFVFDVKLGRTNAPLVARSVVLVILPLCLIVHKYYFLCHLSVFSLKFTIVLQHVLLLNLRLQPTRPYTINTRPYFSAAVIFEKNQPGDEASLESEVSFINISAQLRDSAISILYNNNLPFNTILLDSQVH